MYRISVFCVASDGSTAPRPPADADAAPHASLANAAAAPAQHDPVHAAARLHAGQPHAAAGLLSTERTISRNTNVHQFGATFNLCIFVLDKSSA